MVFGVQPDCCRFFQQQKLGNHRRQNQCQGGSVMFKRSKTTFNRMTNTGDRWSHQDDRRRQIVVSDCNGTLWHDNNRGIRREGYITGWDTLGCPTAAGSNQPCPATTTHSGQNRLPIPPPPSLARPVTHSGQIKRPPPKHVPRPSTVTYPPSNSTPRLHHSHQPDPSTTP